MTDSSGGVIKFKNVESLTVGSYTYTENTSAKFYWNSTEKVLYFYGGGSSSAADINGDSIDGSGALAGFTTGTTVDGWSDTLTVQGSASADSMNLNINRSSSCGAICRWMSGNLVLNLCSGDDTISSAKLKNGDSVDMGAGDDTISLMLTGSYGTPTIASASFNKFDGGAGTDTLTFTESGPNTTALTLTTAGATNFENLQGTAGAETITGDASGNALAGLGGLDTIYGLAGDDHLSAYIDSSSEPSGCGTSANAIDSSNDKLYGGAGDDTLCGSSGDNTLDGGTGKDTITSFDGSDTIVIRSGDGSTDIANADILTDFTDGTDVIGMDGLNYGDLTVQQGSGDYSSRVIVKYGAEFLLVIQNVSVSNMTSSDFTPL